MKSSGSQEACEAHLSAAEWVLHLSLFAAPLRLPLVETPSTSTGRGSIARTKGVAAAAPAKPPLPERSTRGRAAVGIGTGTYSPSALPRMDSSIACDTSNHPAVQESCRPGPTVRGWGQVDTGCPACAAHMPSR